MFDKEKMFKRQRYAIIIQFVLCFPTGFVGPYHLAAYFNQNLDSSLVVHEKLINLVNYGGGESNKKCFSIGPLDELGTPFALGDVCEEEHGKLSEDTQVKVRYRDGFFNQKWMVAYEIWKK